MKKIVSVIALTALMAVSVFGTAVGAYDDCTFDVTAIDGSSGTVTVKDGEPSYDIDFTDPTSPEDFPRAADPMLENCDPDTFYSYFDANYDNTYCFPIVYGFCRKELEYPVVSIEGEKYYVADTEAQTVEYVGYSCITLEEITDDENIDNSDAVSTKTEDGSDFIIYYDGEDSFTGWEIGVYGPKSPEDFPENDDISGAYPVSDTQELAQAQFDVDFDEMAYVDGQYVSGMVGEKYWIIDKAAKTVRYVGHTVDEWKQEVPADDADGIDGCFPETGNRSYAAQAMAISALVGTGAYLMGRKVK
ncbi:hypothetical protein [Huintestinicola butyrica]|uniref:hypothetical protein n=1 Tax=Huintestinicola butyrica TaxID=2981728 RepID=UPI003F7EF89A